MKKVLITGANSYIGTSFEKYIKENFPDDYVIDTVDMTDIGWKEKDFSGYDSVFHVAGIAHQKETKENKYIYYKVNRDLAIETAKKAKSEGVKHFIFLSSMSVYGMDTGVITRETLPNPKSNYGKSKLQAEQEICKLEDENFKVCVLRPPMVYGKGCKGNFVKLKKFAEKLPVFPYINNQRSMIYIDNLSSFVKMSIDEYLNGIYFPQNRSYVSTICIVEKMASVMSKKIYFDHFTGCLIYVLKRVCPMAKKAFGSLIYQNVEDFKFSYIVVENEQSLILSV